MIPAMIALAFVGAALILFGLASIVRPGWWREPPRRRGRR